MGCQGWCTQVCTSIFVIGMDNKVDVLRRSADLLGLDPDYVERYGTLICGDSEVQDLHDFERGQLHEITMVLS